MNTLRLALAFILSLLGGEKDKAVEDIRKDIKSGFDAFKTGWPINGSKTLCIGNIVTSDVIKRNYDILNSGLDEYIDRDRVALNIAISFMLYGYISNGKDDTEFITFLRNASLEMQTTRYVVKESKRRDFIWNEYRVDLKDPLAYASHIEGGVEYYLAGNWFETARISAMENKVGGWVNFLNDMSKHPVEVCETTNRELLMFIEDLLSRLEENETKEAAITA